MLQGVALDDYAGSGLEWGVPRGAVRRPAPRGRLGRRGLLEGPSRAGARAGPPRGRGAAAERRRAGRRPGPAGASPSPPPIPKSAEESYSVPSPYRIVFAEGVSLEVRSKGEGGRNRSALRRFVDALGPAALRPGHRPRPRREGARAAAGHPRGRRRGVALPVAAAGRRPDRRRPAAALTASGRAGRARRRTANARAGFSTSRARTSASPRPRARSAGTNASNRNVCGR